MLSHGKLSKNKRAFKGKCSREEMLLCHSSHHRWVRYIENIGCRKVLESPHNKAVKDIMDVAEKDMTEWLGCRDLWDWCTI
jgi:hypothetical protein